MNEIAYGTGEATDEKMTFSFSTEGMHKPITNGDVIKALFSVKSWEFRTSFTVSVQFEDICEIKLFPLEWWNAPYRREAE